MAAKVINFTMTKEEALPIVKKAILTKFGILSDKGDTLTIGAPLMSATVKVNASSVEVSGSLAGKIVAETAYPLIEQALSEASK